MPLIFHHRNKARPPHVVIFVHGFTGGSKTFLNSKDQALCNYLPDAIKRACDFACFSYTSSLTDCLPSLCYLIPGVKALLGRKNQSITSYASLLESYYYEHKNNYRTVSFICHSMGGLVAKRAILNIHKKEAQFDGFYITLATPHRGVEAAIAGAKFHGHVDEMRPHSPTVLSLSDEWTEHRHNFKRCYFTATYDEIVPSLSSCPPGEESLNVRVEGGHVEICKPESQDDILVCALQRKISDFLDIKSTRETYGISTNSLFLCYFPQVEPYYVTRDVDLELISTLGRCNTWVYGPSGCGKTNLLQRYCSLQEKHVIYVDVTMSGGGAQEALESILSTLLIKIDQIGLGHQEQYSNTVQGIAASLQVLSPDGPITLILDEVSFLELTELAKFVTAVNELCRIYVKSGRFGLLRLVVCTSVDPYIVLNQNLMDALCDYFEPVRLEKWSGGEIEKLYTLVCKDLGVVINKNDEARIFSHAAGSPRRFKQVFRQAASRFQSRQSATFEQAINEALNLENEP